jgi:hypothetical protein
MPPYVWYRPTSLLIRDAIVSLSWSEAWGRVLSLTYKPHGARWEYVGNLTITRGSVGETLARPDILVVLVNKC